ncbi:hypothetical protein FQN60_017313 [Etheostoma spectabile]|uniref:LRAT domain-containing protein n=1 Tax=Etheostoma spectabile TaxID=54343 RepID=A0A5J5DF33_9PERO|nr:hypothetical protein FQN60_017313 [Etheostoma spectabile]
MRKLILVAVILQLVININGFQFGDIISFKPRCKPILGKRFYYQHFAVYVGDRQLPGKGDGQNIFERLNDSPSCVFSALNLTKEHEVANYLDGYKDKKGKEYKAGTEAEITARINKQKFNMTGENLCFNNPFRIKTKDMVKYVRENAECHNNVAGLQVFPQLTLSACLTLLCFILM